MILQKLKTFFGEETRYMKTTILKNVRLITGKQIVDGATIVIEDGKIRSVGKSGEHVDGDVVYDLKGKIAAPGLCDIHTHGAGGSWGFSFNSDDILNMARTLVRFGVTSFLPTTVSLPPEETKKAVLSIIETMRRQPGAAIFNDTTTRNPSEGARILGINMEGPFLSLEKPGAHNPASIRNINLKEMEEIIAAGERGIKVWTLAPEIPGGLEAIELLASRSIVPALGHTNCTFDMAKEAVRKGAHLFTHLFNAMRAVHQREPGGAIAAMLLPEACLELIADGHHLHPEILRLVVRAKQNEKIILITDAISAAGMEEGKFPMWGFDAIIKDGTAQLPDGTLAGSILTLNRAVKNMVLFTGIPIKEAIAMASINPLTLLSLDKHAGTIEPGKAADIAVFDDDLCCHATFVGGTLMYQSENFLI